MQHLQEESAAYAGVLPGRAARGEALVVRAGEVSPNATVPELPMVAAGVVAQPGPGPGNLTGAVAASSGGGLGPPGGAPNDNEEQRATIKSFLEDLEALTVGGSRKKRAESKRDRGSGGEGRKSRGRRSGEARSSSSSRTNRSRSSGSSVSQSRRRRHRRLTCWRPRKSSRRRIDPEVIPSGSKPGRISCASRGATRGTRNPVRLGDSVRHEFRPGHEHQGLHKVDLMRWSKEGTGLKELRDLRDVQTLA